MEKSLSESVVLITGGSSGIGYAIAKEFAKQKRYNLLLVSNQPNQLENCKEELEKNFNLTCYTLNLDLTEPNASKEIVQFCDSKNLVIDVLVNNAGILVFSELVEVSEKEVNSITQLHLNTPTLLCNLFGKRMKDRRQGFILNVSSISSVMPYPGISLYGPTKTYLRYMTRALRTEMSKYNVKVTCLIPGATETGLYDPKKVNIKRARRLGVMHSSEFVAKKAVKALLKGRKRCIPGFLNKLTVIFVPFIPNFIIRLVYKKTRLIKQGSNALG